MQASTFSKEEAMARYVSVALSVVRSRGEPKRPTRVCTRCSRFFPSLASLDYAVLRGRCASF